MNENTFRLLAQRIAENPKYLEESEEETLRELLLRHSQKLLSPEIGHEMDELIRVDPLAKAIWQEFCASDDHLRTESGRAWLEAAGDRILSNLLGDRFGDPNKTSADLNTSAQTPGLIPFGPLINPDRYKLAASPLSKIGMTEFRVQGQPAQLSVHFDQLGSRRWLVVWDCPPKEIPSPVLDGWRVVGRTKGNPNIHELGIVRDCGSELPFDGIEWMLKTQSGADVILEPITQ